MKLKEIFELASTGQLTEDFCYLPKQGNWTVETEGQFIEWTEQDLEAKANLPKEATEKLLVEGLDGKTIECIVEWADRLAGKKDDDARLYVFLYYHKNDAFPNNLNAPEPPPTNEILMGLDREFFDKLSVDPNRACKNENCDRPATKYGVFCKIHHFENVKKKPCPFNQ